MGIRLAPHTFFEMLSGQEFNGWKGTSDSQKIDSKSAFQQEIRRRFSLIAVVLHDPQGHPYVEDELQQNFDYLDEITGEDFLFITFSQIEQSVGYSNRRRLNRWQQIASDFVKYGSPKPTTTSMNSHTCLTLSVLLGIPIDYFPCVVLISVEGLFQLGNQNRPSSGAWISARNHSVGQLLSRFSRFAQSAQASFDLWDFQRLVDLVLREEGQFTWGLLDDQARAVRSIGRVFSLNRKNQINGHTNMAIQDQISQMFDDVELDSEDPYFSTYMQGLLSLESRRQYFDERLIDVFGDVVEYLEYGVKVNLECGIRFIKMGRMHDFSAVIVALAKGLEIFFNGSFVQDMRLKQGIPMPENFRRLYPFGEETEYSIQVGNRVVDLNRAHPNSGAWMPLSLGNLCALQGKYWKRYHEVSWAYSKQLDGLRLMRNPAVHDGLVTSKMAHECLTVVKEIMNEPQFKQLVDIANRLRFSGVTGADRG